MIDLLRLAVNLLSSSHSTMIPPCDPSILENNPQFKRLYENLTANLLNPDGSSRTKPDPAQEAVVEVRRDAPDSSIRNPSRLTITGPETMPNKTYEEKNHNSEPQETSICRRQ